VHYNLTIVWIDDLQENNFYRYLLQASNCYTIQFLGIEKSNESKLDTLSEWKHGKIYTKNSVNHKILRSFNKRTNK